MLISSKLPSPPVLNLGSNLAPSRAPISVAPATFFGRSNLPKIGYAIANNFLLGTTAVASLAGCGNAGPKKTQIGSANDLDGLKAGAEVFLGILGTGLLFGGTAHFINSYLNKTTTSFRPFGALTELNRVMKSDVGSLRIAGSHISERTKHNLIVAICEAFLKEVQQTCEEYEPRITALGLKTGIEAAMYAEAVVKFAGSLKEKVRLLNEGIRDLGKRDSDYRYLCDSFLLRFQVFDTAPPPIGINQNLNDWGNQYLDQIHQTSGRLTQQLRKYVAEFNSIDLYRTSR